MHESIRKYLDNTSMFVASVNEPAAATTVSPPPFQVFAALLIQLPFLPMRRLCSSEAILPLIRVSSPPLLKS